jgi:hypothetical protein
MVAVVVGALLAGCGDADRAQAGPPSAPASLSTHVRTDAMPYDVEVYVDIPPTKRYQVIATYRYPASRSAGKDVPSLKEQVRRDGGDALLVRVVSGNLGRTDIEQESLIEAQVLTWLR